MFGTWFTPKWKQRNVRARISAVKNLSNNAEQQQILQQLALQDPDATVRRTAQQQLNDLPLLLKISQQDSEANNREAAQQRLHEQLCEQQFSTNIAELLDQHTSTSLLKLAKEAKQIELCQHALQRLHDEKELAELTINAGFSQIRQQAAERIQTQSLLEQLIKTCKGHDKKVHQQLKQRLKQIKDQEKQQQADEQLRLQLCQELESHSSATYTNGYQSKLEKTVRHWQRLEQSASNDLQSRFSAAQQACLSLIDQRQQSLKETDSEQKQAAQNQQQQQAEQLKAIEQVQQQHNDQLQRELQKVQQRLQKGGSQQRVIDNLKATLNKHAWPADFAQSELGLNSTELLQKLAQQQQNWQTQQRDKAVQLSHKLQQLEHALETGNLTQSNQRHKEIERLNRELGHSVSKAQQNQFQHLHARHQELRDWQGFATTPKKEALCQQMETLIEIDMPADELSQQINNLQTEWKKLGASDPKTAQQLWLRFKGAADQAYEPCKSHFAAQQQQRQHNLQQRLTLCDQLEQFIPQNNSAEEPDWQTVEKVIRVTKQEWGNYRQVQRGEAKSSQIRFNKLLKILQDQLDGEREKNTQLKQQIVERAQQLIEQDELSSAMHEAKQLQKKWQAIGTTFYKQDRQLWKQFRSACDAIFARKETEKAAEQAALEQHQQQAEKLISEVEQLSQENILAETGLTKMQQLQQQFETVGELPKTSFKNLQQRFESAQLNYSRCCEQQQQQQQQQQRLQQQDQLRQQAKLCQQLEHFDSSDSNNTRSIETLCQQWQTQQGQESILNPRFQNALECCQNDRIETLQKHSETLLPQRQQLCIQLEILLGLESPSEDQARRMQYQVERLNQGLTQNQNNPSSSQQQLEEQWLCLGPLADPKSLQLEQRFQLALQNSTQTSTE